MAKHTKSGFTFLICCLLGLMTSGTAWVAAAQAAPERAYFEFDPADQVVEAALFADPNDHEADIEFFDGDLWITWLRFVPGEGEYLWTARSGGQGENLFIAEDWTDQQRLNEEAGSYRRPTLTADAHGRLWLSYEAEADGQWDVFLAQRTDEGNGFVRPRAVSSGTGPDINHRLAAGPDGELWIVWQAAQEGRFVILARQMTADGMSGIHTVSESGTAHGAAGGSSWQPDVAITADGTVIVAWDQHDGESYNILARARSAADGKWAPIVSVASTPAFEGRASLAAGPDGRAWVAWEEGELNWGRPYRPALVARPVRTMRVHDDPGPLNRFRRVRLAALECRPSGEIVVRHVKEPLPMPAMESAVKRADAPKGVSALGSFYAAPHLVIDAAGRLWMVYRQRYAPWMGIEPNHHVDEGWGLYARCLTSEGWSPALRFELGQGDGMQRIALSPHADGLAAAWATGRMDRRKDQPPRGTAGSFFALPESAGSSAPALEPAIQARAAPAAGNQQPKVKDPGPAPITVNGRTYHLVFGDLHRHTDLSLCFVPSDGTIEDAYRYAIDAGGLDFLGITDHTHDLAWGDGLSLVWWRSTKEVLRHELPPAFFPMYAYERSRRDTDHNVVSLRPDVLRPHTYPHPEFWQELDDDTFTIPHQPFNRETFDSQDDDRRPLLEIYQGLRDASMEEHAHFGLDRGYLFGFIASSDHLSTSASYAGVWVEQRTRENTFRSLQARRTFGATDRIRLLVRAGDHLMGERFSAAICPPLHIEIDGTAAIESVEMIVDGHVRETRHPAAPRVAFTWTPPELPPGPHYLYVRILQADGNQAWSSPIWVHIGTGLPRQSP